MAADPTASASTRVWRALTRKCPRCGAPAFKTYFGLAETCPSCGFRFEREHGYWVGAMIINTTFVFGTFLLSFVGGILITWPDVPWTQLLIILLLINGILPVLFYPLSKTLWSAFEMGWHPLEPEEIEAAALRMAG